MAYQLPPELQTRKLNSLPEKERTIADELIAKKFGFGEVLTGYVREESDFLEATMPMRNCLKIFLKLRGNRSFNFVMQLDTLMQSQLMRTTRLISSSGLSSQCIELAKLIDNQMSRRMWDERILAGDIEYMEVELNGYRDKITNFESLARFIERNI